MLSSRLPTFINVLPCWWGEYGWFFGVAISGIVYFLLSTMVPKPAAHAAS